ncbi:MAG TPA: hypothetical protein PLC48_07685 [Ferruginibacter sp.]|nr:hypothetical protein [Ferruginibacter sp.]
MNEKKGDKKGCCNDNGAVDRYAHPHLPGDHENKITDTLPNHLKYKTC